MASKNTAPVSIDKKINKIGAALGDIFRERKDEIHGLFCALLAKEHVFWLGSPGTAKSELIRAFASVFDAPYFELLLTRFTPPEKLFGPVDIAALKAGKYRHITTDKLPECKIALLDEIWNANSAILNELLTMMNERLFHNDGKPTKCPLITAVCASNGLPEDDSLKAMFDRILLRYHVEYLTDKSFWDVVANAPASGDWAEKIALLPKISQADIEQAQKDVAFVTIGTETADALLAMRQALKSDGIIISDRRFIRATKVLRANAYLEGRASVGDDDYEILQHILWEQPTQIAAIKKVIQKCANPIWTRASDLYDAAKEVGGKALAATDDQKAVIGVEAASKLKKGLAELKKLAVKSQRVVPLANEIDVMFKKVLKECLGFENDDEDATVNADGKVAV